LQLSGFVRNDHGDDADMMLLDLRVVLEALADRFRPQRGAGKDSANRPRTKRKKTDADAPRGAGAGGRGVAHAGAAVRNDITAPDGRPSL